MADFRTNSTNTYPIDHLTSVTVVPVDKVVSKWFIEVVSDQCWLINFFWVTE